MHQIFQDYTLLWSLLEAVGLIAIVAGLLGHFVVGCFHKMQTSRFRTQCEAAGIAPPESPVRLHIGLSGDIERFIFACAVVAFPSQVVTAIGGWMVLKMATHWQNRPSIDGSQMTPEERGKARAEAMVWNSYGFLGLVSGLLSMAFAVAGGLAAMSVLPLDFSSHANLINSIKVANP